MRFSITDKIICVFGARALSWLTRLPLLLFDCTGPLVCVLAPLGLHELGQTRGVF
jgi:hypothetical protein